MSPALLTIALHLAGAPAAKYDVVEVSVTVSAERPNGKAWDTGGGAPDPVAVWRLDGREVASCTARNQTTVICFPRRPVIVRSGSVLEVVVSDKDPGKDDPIGSAQRTLRLSELTTGMPVNLTVTGRLESAHIVFGKPKAEPETAETAEITNGPPYPELVGLGAGILLAMLLIAGLRDRLFSHEVT